MQRYYSTIIPFYGNKETLEKVLCSLINTNYAYKEIILVSDGSRHDLTSIAEQFQCRLINIPKRQGPSFARNRGSEVARFEYLIFLDSDIILPKDSFIKINSFLDTKSASALNCLVSVQIPYNNFPSQYANIYFRYSILKEANNTIFTSFCIIKADSFYKVGGFDESVPFAYADDLVLGWKLRNNGYAFSLIEEIEVQHYKQMSFLKLVPYWLLHAYYMEKYFIIYRKISDSPKAFYKKEGPLSVITILFSLMLVYLGLYGLFTVMPILLCILLMINYKFLNFVVKEKGLFFALKTIPIITIQQFIYFIGGTMGVLNSLLHIISNLLKKSGRYTKR
jgi:glycosyltransferase involved in cell wall biosynthesis